MQNEEEIRLVRLARTVYVTMKREELIPRYDRGDTNSSSFRSIVGRGEVQGNWYLHFISDSI